MQSQRPLVSCVVPAFNRAAIIESHLDGLCRCMRSLEQGYDFEVLVINDGSIDKTGVLADAFARRNPEVSVRHHLTQRGSRAALRAGFDNARGDIVITQDLDFSCEPHHIAAMLGALKETNASIVLASPYTGGGNIENFPWVRKQLSAWANRYLSIATGGKIATLTCVMRAYVADAIRKLTLGPDELDFNDKIIFAALRNHVPIVEVPARMVWRPDGSSSTGEPPSAMTILLRLWSVLVSGIRYRPSMILAAPGIVPGLLPTVLAVLSLARPSAEVVALATGGTMAVQLSSMVFAVVLAGSYVRQVRRRRGGRSSLTEGTRRRHERDADRLETNDPESPAGAA